MGGDARLFVIAACGITVLKKTSKSFYVHVQCKCFSPLSLMACIQKQTFSTRLVLYFPTMFNTCPSDVILKWGHIYKIAWKITSQDTVMEGSHGFGSSPVRVAREN